MNKILILLLILSSKTYAGFYDSEYFEPAAACLVGAGVGYASASKGDEGKNAALFCAAGGAIVYLVNSHYYHKYGREFNDNIRFLENKIQNYKLLEEQQDKPDKQSEKNNSPFRVEREVIPAQLDGKGQGVGIRVKEKLILEDSKDMIGD